MLTKEKIISGIMKLPDPVSIEEILDEVILIYKIEKGLVQAENGQVLSEEEFDNRVSKWLK